MHCACSKFNYSIFQYQNLRRPSKLGGDADVREAAAAAAGHLLSQAVGGSMPQHYQRASYVQMQMLRSAF